VHKTIRTEKLSYYLLYDGLAFALLERLDFDFDKSLIYITRG
jgi:hypothetical protein